MYSDTPVFHISFLKTTHAAVTFIMTKNSSSLFILISLCPFLCVLLSMFQHNGINAGIEVDSGAFIDNERINFNVVLKVLFLRKNCVIGFSIVMG